jgi:uncharacterized protein with NRDE domain
MCLILVVWQSHRDYPLIVAANRDEFRDRPAAPADFWPDHPQIFAGRDLLAGGTWLGITRAGRFAAVTNYRGAPRSNDAASRGALVSDFLAADCDVAEAILALGDSAARYNGFNLVLYDGARLGVFESVPARGRLLEPGIYGLSNHLLDTPWPKVTRGKSRLRAALEHADEPDRLLEVLRDDVPAVDSELPRTGADREWERLLSSAFIRAPDYGTRSSSVVRIDRGGMAYFDEWTWDAAGAEVDAVHAKFALTRGAPGRMQA